MSADVQYQILVAMGWGPELNQKQKQVGKI